MITLRERHTGQNLKEKIQNILEEYGSKLDNLYSVTVDNGSNVIKAIQIMEDEVENIYEEEDEEDEEDGNICFLVNFP